jgi:hypothetical protein
VQNLHVCHKASKAAPPAREIARDRSSRPKSGDTFQSRRIDRRRLFGISREAAHLLAMNAQLLFFFAAPQRFELAAGNDPGYEACGDNLKGV